MNATDVKEALHRRYAKPSQGKPGERYVCIEEARSGAGFQGNNGQCDFLAINTWRSRGMELIGHEVKVSRADWTAELADPAKAERFAQYCCRWYVVAPSALASDIKHEVPPAWGLLSVSDAGRVTQTVDPQPRDPAPVPEWWWVGWLAQVDRQHKRRLPLLIREGMEGERERMREEIERSTAEKDRWSRDQSEQLAEAAEALREATGIDLRHVYKGDLSRLKEAWALLRKLPYLDGLEGNLRKAADALATARETEQTLVSVGASRSVASGDSREDVGE